MIKNSVVLLGIWAVYGLKGDFPGPSSFPSEMWRDPVWNKVAEWGFYFAYSDLANFEYPAFIALTRNALTYGSVRTRKNCMKMLVDLYRYRVGSPFVGA